jgi:hypothetical protein
MVHAFGWRISWSTLYKERQVKDIDIFFTDKSLYDDFISVIHDSIGKGKLTYNKKQIARYQYVEDKSTINYEWKKIDINLVSHFQEIEEILAAQPEIMDYFIDLFKTIKCEKEQKTEIDENIFNPETKSFWAPIVRDKFVYTTIYKIPKNISMFLEWEKK